MIEDRIEATSSDGMKFSIPKKDIHIGKRDWLARAGAAAAFVVGSAGIAGILFEAFKRPVVQPNADASIVQTVGALETQNVANDSKDCGVMDVFGQQLGFPALNTTECAQVRATVGAAADKLPTNTPQP